VSELDAEALVALWRRAEAEGTLLAEGPRGRVLRVSYDDESDAVLKSDRPPDARKRLGALLRGARGARALSAGRALLAAGFRVPEPLGACVHEGLSLHAARCVEGPTLSAALAEADSERAATLARSAALLAARLHAAGFVFRDLKPPNLIVSPAGLVPVDLDDARRSRRVPRRAAWRNLAALDAYAQLGERPLGVRARLGALRVYAVAREAELGPLLRAVLPLSRAKLARWRR